MKQLKANFSYIFLGCAIFVGLLAQLSGPFSDREAGLGSYTLADTRTHSIVLSVAMTVDIYRVAGNAVHSYAVGRWQSGGKKFYKVVDAFPGSFHSIRTIRTDEVSLAALVYERESGERVMRLYNFSDPDEVSGIPEMTVFSREEIVSEWDFHAATCSITSSRGTVAGGVSEGTTYNYLASHRIDEVDRQLPVSEFINSLENYMCVREVSAPLPAVEWDLPGS